MIIKDRKSNKNLSKKIIHFIIIFIFLFFQFGLINIKNLGLITDDWSYFRTLRSSESQSFQDLLSYKIKKDTLGYTFSRPLGVLTSLMQLSIFGLDIALHHIWILVMLFLCMVLLYEILLLVLKEGKVSLITTLIFIAIPFHTSTYYWLATRVSIYAFLFALLSFRSLLSARKWIRNIVGPVLFAVSISGYEIFLVFLPLYFYLLFFTDIITDSKIKERLITFSLYLFSSSILFIYRKLFLVSYLGYSLPKEVNTDISITGKYALEAMISSIFGKSLFEYFTTSFNQIGIISNLENYLVVLVLLVLFLSIILIKNIYPSNNYLQEENIKLLLHMGVIIVTFGLISFLFTNYSYSLGSTSDRVNLVVSLGLSFLLVSFLQIIPGSVSKYLFVALLFVFTLVNLIYLSSHIVSYRYQMSFVNYVRELNIPDNSLVYLNTDMSQINGVPILSTSWGLTHMISYATGNENVEYVGSWGNRDKVGENVVEKFESKQYKNYTYKNPNVIMLDFNWVDIN